ncbi:hypothetical protein MUP77_10135 [Candidatus Bathyarchaeota archaeon]|nr:hypothetical protein [Candidatus Bathyarchaeota archaeon]
MPLKPNKITHTRRVRGKLNIVYTKIISRGYCMLNSSFKKALTISLFALIASVILPGVVMLSPPFVAVNAVDPDWTVTITITQGANFETVMFADHMDDLNSGNWISLSGGTAISLPYLKGEYAGVNNVQYTNNGKDIDISSLFSSKTVVYPLNTHPVWRARILDVFPG